MNFDEKTKAAMQALYDYANNSKEVISEMSRREIKAILAPATGGGFADVVFNKFNELGFLKQITAGFGYEENGFEITEVFFRAAEELINAPSSNPEQQEALTYARFKDNLLIALKRKQDVAGPRIYDSEEVAEESAIYYQPGWIRMALDDFDNAGHVTIAPLMRRGAVDGTYCKLLGAGYKEAERLIAESKQDSASDTPDTSAPASDRTVKRSDNEPAWVDAVEQTANLLDKLDKANDYGDLEESEFKQRINEVKAIELLLGYPQVQWSVLDALAQNTVKFLAQKFIKTAIGRAAEALLTKLLSFVF